MSKISLKMPFWPRISTVWRKTSTNWFIKSLFRFDCGNLRRASVAGLSGTLCRSQNQKTPTRSNLKSSTRRWFSISSQTNNYYRVIQHITSSILTSSTSQNFNIFLVIHKIFIFIIQIWNFYHKRHILCQVKINQWPGMAQLGRKDNLFTASSFLFFTSYHSTLSLTL